MVEPTTPVDLAYVTVFEVDLWVSRLGILAPAISDLQTVGSSGST